MKWREKLGKFGWWSGTLSMFAIRGFLLAGLLMRGGWLYYLFALGELVALGFGIAAVILSRTKDYTASGLLVSSAYAAGVWLIPVVKEVQLVTFVLGCASYILTTWALINLQARFTFGGLAWLSLCSSGPYRFVRHPQQAARLLLLTGLLISASSFSDQVRLVAGMFLALAVVWMEERFLSSQPDYVVYRGRVQWQLMPGLV